MPFEGRSPIRITLKTTNNMETAKPNKGLSLILYVVAYGDSIRKKVLIGLISAIAIYGAVNLLG